MLDSRIRRAIDPALDRLGAILARWGLGANAVTVAGFVVGMAAWGALAARAYALAAALILGNRLADGLDGAVARRNGLTDLGGYLDIVLDFFFYAGVPFFFAVGQPDAALPAGKRDNLDHHRATREDVRLRFPSVVDLPGLDLTREATRAVPGQATPRREV